MDISSQGKTILTTNFPQIYVIFVIFLSASICDASQKIISKKASEKVKSSYFSSVEISFPKGNNLIYNICVKI